MRVEILFPNQLKSNGKLERLVLLLFFYLLFLSEFSYDFRYVLNATTLYTKQESSY